jgi:hypothetical protein
MELELDDETHEIPTIQTDKIKFNATTIQADKIKLNVTTIQTDKIKFSLINYSYFEPLDLVFK